MEMGQTVILCLSLVFIKFLIAGGNSKLRASFNVNGTRNDAGIWSANIGEFQAEVEYLSKSSKHHEGFWSIQVEHTAESSSSSITSINSYIEHLVSLARQPVSLNPNPEEDYVQLTSISYYKYHHSLLPWSEALATCESEGAYLAIINSEIEFDIFDVMINFFYEEPLPPGSKPYYSGIYLGFHNLYDINSSVTIFNESLSAAGYDTWQQVYPYHTLEERCGGMFHFRTLVLVSCSLPLPFVCERDVSENQVTALGKARTPVNELKRRLESGTRTIKKTSA